MAHYIQTYSAMNDDELLNLALQKDSLLPEAQWALTSILRERRIGDKDIEEQKRRRDEAGAEDRSTQHLSFSLHGLGTTTCGKRDFEADGSFITTKWIIFLWIPVVPLKSLRVIPIVERSKSPLWSRQEYRTIGEFRPNLRQVAFTYLYEIGFICAALRLFFTIGSLTPFYAVIALWACVPWLLRRISKL